ncbi:MAG: Hsp20/alpha crystallin family protein [Deltaproteobacteria bacterium]|nr:Hsp20/alpha crystallin family protein [Deltaproteobacteria bacterium]
MPEGREITAGQETVPAAAEQTRNAPVYTPEVDIYETEGELVLVADLPGLAKEDLVVHLEDDTLTLEGEVKPVGATETLLLQEYRTGRYFRQFTVSEHVDRTKINARLKDGQLTLHLPKAAAAKPQRIEVQTG